MANSTTNAPNTDGMIRNISQTCQERETIRTCPDLIIYLDGKTYLLNPYITNTTQGQPYTFVSFNDYLQNFSASYDVDNLVPSGNFTLQVANHLKYLFQASGGNNLITSMMEVQVFAKGYFSSGNGNTVYHRVFKGITSHVAHTENGMFLEISVQCLGILHLLEHMFVDLNPALLRNSEQPVTPMGSAQFKMNPYEMLAAEFQKDITFEGFELNAIKQGAVVGHHWEQAVKAGFANKFQPILVNLRKEVHITGYSMGSPLPVKSDEITNQPEDAEGSSSPNLQAAKVAQKSLLAQNAPHPDYYVDVIRKYHPDMSIGSIQLTNGRIVSRLERIRTIVQMIGYEGFQDLDGTIIFKPPLYNLDVTNIGSGVTSTASSIKLSDATNPFIVHLSELESESESEDQQAIKATRMTIQPSIDPSHKLIADSTTSLLRPTATHIDIPKMARFGLREEPARTLGWLAWGDTRAAYAYAVSELNRANRGWRTYNLTIPLRPELRLGFPMYLPHKDMYGYIKTISISYSFGGAATMTIALDTLRKRPVFPSIKAGSNPTSVLTPDSVVYTTQPNLVMEWTTAPSETSSPTLGYPLDASNGCIEGGFDGTRATDISLMGLPATQLQPADKPIYAEEMEVISARRSQYGTSWETKADTRTKSFRVQYDSSTGSYKNGSGAPIKVGDRFFSSANWHDDAAIAPITSIEGTITPSISSNHLSSLISQSKVNLQDVAEVNKLKAQSGVQVTTSTGVGSQSKSNLQSVSKDTSGKNKGINDQYLRKILSCQPYTDEGGYELVTPFPWGRWKSLTEVLIETHEGFVVTNPNSTESQQVAGTDAFLFAGVGSPSIADTAATLQSNLALQKVSNQAASGTTFEIVTPLPGGNQVNILANQQPDSLLDTTLKQDISNAISAFLIGNIPPQPGSSLSQAINLVDDTSTNDSGVLSGTGGSGTGSTANAFIQKLIHSNITTQ